MWSSTSRSSRDARSILWLWSAARYWVSPYDANVTADRSRLRPAGRYPQIRFVFPYVPPGWPPVPLTHHLHSLRCSARRDAAAHAEEPP